MNLETFNALSADAAIDALSQCCTSERWQQQLTAARPFDDIDALNARSENIWAELDEADYLQAFDGHPRIGDVNSLKAKYANTHNLASSEQSSVNQAADDVIQQLADGNTAYEEKNGFIFIVCATGKSAAQMLEILNARLPNSRQQEIQNAAEEQRKITRIRIDKLFDL
ncbi:MAG: 2-oxo-4-hydroxy-4-carboxy-5-ureidoimidazoline decarboxylase [Gammaproteobacteria bacterium]|nr:2-oxo-4-hydroxy-4-carboxy-5-ureidoimidazoline decarboxylase [Gammaproteobacteria bacterium]